MTHEMMKKQNPKKRGELLWPRMMMKKWLNIKSSGEEFSADEFSADEHEDTEPDTESESESENKSKARRYTQPRRHTTRNFSSLLPKSDDMTSRKKIENAKAMELKVIERQYNKQHFRVAVGTWNVAGQLPPPHLELKGWLEINDPADIYIIGFQEIVPLNAGNVFGAEDTAPAAKWQALIRETLNRPRQSKIKCYSAPPSPSREKLDGFDSFRVDTSDSDHGQDAGHVLVDEERSFIPLELNPPFNAKDGLFRQSSVEGKQQLVEVYRTTERIGLNVPRHCRIESEPKDWLSACNFEEMNATANGEVIHIPLQSSMSWDDSTLIDPAKKSTRYVRVASKQMVGIHVSVWVRRKLRCYIRSLTVSCVGLGIMGCLGNKGSISISMVLHQTSFCFVCAHLTSGAKEDDELRRNADVNEILNRTRFPTIRIADTEAPKTIMGHDLIIWFGDLNYRINLPDIDACFYVAREDWTALLDKDQLKRELMKGHVFEGWHEGYISFAPTYKYEIGLNSFSGENAKSGEKRRIPAWCDRILWRGKGLMQLVYKREDNTLSDHRPVTAVFMAEIEVINEQKLKKALTFKSAKVEIEELLSHVEAGIAGNKIELQGIKD